ncbi:hypothetical protein LINPERHAP1_LOCUS14681 [Linum perenne]
MATEKQKFLFPGELQIWNLSVCFAVIRRSDQKEKPHRGKELNLSRLFLLLSVLGALCVLPSVGWPLGSNGCGLMAVTRFPLSELQARQSPEYAFMAISFLFCCRFWRLDCSMEFWSGRFLGQSRRNYHDADPPLCTVWRGSFINSLLTQIRVLFLTLASIQIGVWRKDVGPPIGFSSNESNFPFCAGVPVCSFRFGCYMPLSQQRGYELSWELFSP